MSWFTRIFGHHDAPAASPETTQSSPDAPAASAPEAIPAERRGPDGTFDQSGLAKRVVVEFDNRLIEDAPHLYVAQHDTTVVFKGNIHSKELLDRLVEIASAVEGATAVDTSEVHVV